MTLTDQIEAQLKNSNVNPTAEKIWREALAQPEFANVGVVWAYASMASSDHRNGRCLDVMVTHTKKPLSRDEQIRMGNAIRSYFVKHADRLHVEGIIWNGKVTGFPENGPTYRGPSGFARDYHGSDKHRDHPHIQVSGREPKSWLTKPDLLTYYAKKDGVIGYKIRDGVGVKDRTKDTGHQIRGVIKSRSDGKYLVTPGSVWYPLDDLTKTKPVKPAAKK